MRWLQKYRFHVMVVLFGIAVLLLLLVFFNSLKKDHTLHLVKQEMKLKEESRLQIEQLRQQVQQQINEKDMALATMAIRDSLLHTRTQANDTKITNLQKRYHENNERINNYSSADLQQYFSNLPEQPTHDY